MPNTVTQLVQRFPHLDPARLHSARAAGGPDAAVYVHLHPSDYEQAPVDRLITPDYTALGVPTTTTGGIPDAASAEMRQIKIVVDRLWRVLTDPDPHVQDSARLMLALIGQFVPGVCFVGAWFGPDRRGRMRLLTTPTLLTRTTSGDLG